MITTSWEWLLPVIYDIMYNIYIYMIYIYIILYVLCIYCVIYIIYDDFWDGLWFMAYTDIRRVEVPCSPSKGLAAALELLGEWDDCEHTLW